MNFPRSRVFKPCAAAQWGAGGACLRSSSVSSWVFSSSVGADAQPPSSLKLGHDVRWVGGHSPWVDQARRSGCVELAPVSLKDRKRTVIGPQAQHPLARMAEHAASLEHQLLHHGANAP